MARAIIWHCKNDWNPDITSDAKWHRIMTTCANLFGGVDLGDLIKLIHNTDLMVLNEQSVTYGADNEIPF